MCTQNDRQLPLNDEGLVYFENPDGFHLNTDSLLLSRFVRVRRHDRVLELCCGNGAGLLLQYSRQPEAVYTGIDVDEDAIRRFLKAISANHVPHDRMSAVPGDIKNRDILKSCTDRDVVFVNPPFYKDCQPDERHPGARSETLCTLEDVLTAAHTCLKDHGRLFMIYPPHRLQELLGGMERHDLQLKRMEPVFRAGGSCRVLLLEAVKHARKGGTVIAMYKVPEKQ